MFPDSAMHVLRYFGFLSKVNVCFAQSFVQLFSPLLRLEGSEVLRDYAVNVRCVNLVGPTTRALVVGGAMVAVTFWAWVLGFSYFASMQVVCIFYPVRNSVFGVGVSDDGVRVRCRAPVWQRDFAIAFPRIWLAFTLSGISVHASWIYSVSV